MPLYAYKCPICEKVVFQSWGDFRCSTCGVNLIRSKVEQGAFEKLTKQQQDDLFPEVKERKAAALAIKKIEDEEKKRYREELAKYDKMIFTTTETVSDHEIDEYLGLVAGSSFYARGGVLDEGYLGNRPSELYQSGLDDALKGIKHNARQFHKIPDAVIGIKASILSTEMGEKINLTGTAVTFKK